MSQQTVSPQMTMDEFAKRLFDLEAKAPAFAEISTSMEKLETALAQANKQGEKGGFNLPSVGTFMPNKSDLPIVIAGVGAGTGGLLVGLVQQYIPQVAAVHPAWIEIILGWLGYKYFLGKQNMASAYFSGLVIGGVASFVQGLVQPAAG